MPEPSYDIGTFCAAERIARSTLYKLWREGKGPRFYLLGNIRRITEEARREWQREREADTIAAKSEAAA